MNLKFSLSALRRRAMLLIVVVALSAAMLPTAAFASGGNYGRQGRAYDPGPRQHHGQHRPARQHDDKHYNKNHNQKHHNDKHDNRCDATYRVKKGDSLSEIAQWYGVSVHQLAKANGIKNPNRIYKGQVICIPC